MYRQGLGWDLLGDFSDHQGFDGAMVGEVDAAYHLEFTAKRTGHVLPSPTAEDLLVLYIPVLADWQMTCVAMVSAGFVEVSSFNPYWDIHGKSFIDPDGYRVVLQNASWPPVA